MLSPKKATELHNTQLFALKTPGARPFSPPRPTLGQAIAPSKMHSSEEHRRARRVRFIQFSGKEVRLA